MPRKAEDILVRFNRSYKITESGCWEWQLSLHNGYGVFVVDGKKVPAHVWSYIHFNGDYDRLLDIDHTCHNNTGCRGGVTCEHRSCVNPDHLEPVTRKENANRGETGQYLARRTHCKNGHEFTPENTILTKIGRRRCRACRAEEFQKFKRQNPDKYKKAYTKANKKRKWKSN